MSIQSPPRLDLYFTGELFVQDVKERERFQSYTSDNCSSSSAPKSHPNLRNLQTEGQVSKKKTACFSGDDVEA